MTVLLVVIGAAASALGTRGASLAFAAAAVSAATGGASIAALATWTAATAAGWVLLTSESPRKLALPAVGLAAVLAAGLVPNGAVVLGLWVIATAAAVAARGVGPDSDSWAVCLGALDFVLVGCIASTSTRGFEGWPQTVTSGWAAVMLGLACLRALLSAGPDDDTSLPGLLGVRAQSVLLAAFALAAGGTLLSEAAVVIAALAFAVAPVLPRRSIVDCVQEFALVLMAVASADLGWGDARWAWGALAAGTLIHYLRFTSRRTRGAPFARALATSAGIGLPLLPVIVAQLAGAVGAPRLLAATVLIGLGCGLAARARMAFTVPRRAATVADEIRGGAVVALAAVASVVGVVFTLPRPPAADPVPAPSVWAGVIVLAVGLAGSRLSRVVGGARRQPVAVRLPRAVVDRTQVVARFATERVVWAAVGVLAACAVVMWVIGASRGFL